MGRRRLPRAMAGLAGQWEKEESIRWVAREQKLVLRCGGKPTFRPTVKSIALHHELFKAVVAWMATTEKQAIPDIAPLQKELQLYYGMVNLQVGPDQIYRESWGIRYGAGFIKRKGRRKEITKARVFPGNCCS